MPASVEERIVAMSFENAQFEARVAQTLNSLGKLDTAVKNINGTEGLENIEKSGNKVGLKAPLAALDKLREKLGRSGQGAEQGMSDIERAGNKVQLEQPNKALDKTQAKMDQLSAGKTFSDIEKASQQVELAGISKAIDGISGKFGMMQQAASVAMGNIASQAAMKGAAFGKSFAMGPIQQGFDEYGTNMKSIQTIMANTEGQQVSGLEAVNSHLDELNTYADQTIYNFSEMARNIGTFTAAGVDLPTATASIKGIANLAALSGSNSQQASTAMYQLSQSIAAGKVGLQDWNSVVNAGMGGAVFQKALMRTAENMGTVADGAVKIDKATGKATVNGESFRNSIMAAPGKESWLTSDVLTETLSQLTGDMTMAELKAKGYSDEMAKAIMKQADTAKRAATEVKTLPQVWEVAREGIGSGWAKTFQLIFGDFEQAKKTFTDLSNFINGWIGKVSDARNELIAGWSLGGGRNDLIEGLKNAFVALMRVINPIKDAFREIFPPATVAQLLDTTERFKNFTKSLQISGDTMDLIKRTFAGVFAVVKIGKAIIGGVIGVILDLIGAVGKGGDGFLGFTAKIGDFLVAVSEVLTNGGVLEKFFDGLSSVLQKPVELIGKLIRALADLFSGSGEEGSSAADKVDKIRDSLSPLANLADVAKEAWARLVDAFQKTREALEPWFSSFVDKLSTIGQVISNAISNISFEEALKGVQTGLMVGIFLQIKKLFGSGGGLMDSLSDTLGGVQELIGGLTGNLENMQKKVQAQLIMAIAAAVLALAGGVWVLSTIDGDKLAKAMFAVAVGLGQLMGAMKLMMGGMGKWGALQLPLIAAGIVGLAIAVTIMAGALKIMGSLSWNEIARGLTGLAGSLLIIAGAMRLMPPGGAMVVQGGAMILLGLGLLAIGSSVKLMASMKWEDLGRGLYGIISALGILATTMSMMPPNLLVSAAGILALSFALVVMSGAIKAMGSMDLLTILKGVGAILGALTAIAWAMTAFGPAAITGGVGLFIVANGLVILAKAMQMMGEMSLWEIVKSLTALGGALALLSVGLYLMIGSLPGSLALLAAAAAIAVLAPALGLLGQMSFGTIFKGLLAIGLALFTIGTAGLIAAPALAALGISLIPLGVGFMLVATAAKIFANAIALLGDTGQKGLAVFLVAITGFMAILPTILIQFLKGLVDVIAEVAKIAPKVIEAIGKILTMVIAFVIEQAPNLALAIGTLVNAIVLVLAENAPKLIASGVQLVKNLLDGIAQNIGGITTKVADIVIRFLDALKTKIPQLIAAGANVLRAFLDGVGSRFGEIATSVGNLIVKFTQAVGNQAQKITGAAATMMGKFVAAISTFGAQLVLAGTAAILDFLNGVAEKAPDLINKGVDVAKKLMRGISDGLVSMADAGFKAIIRFLNGIENAIRENSSDLIDAGIGIGDAILDGVIEGFSKGGALVKRALESVFKLLPGWAKKILGIKSPSVVFDRLGQATMAGYQLGIEKQQPNVKATMEKSAADSVGYFERVEAKARARAEARMAKGMRHTGTMSGQGFIDGYAEMVPRMTGLMSSTAMKVVWASKDALGIRSPSEVFRDIGMNVNRGFRDGLMGSREDVIGAFEDMNSTLIDKIRDLREQVKDGNGRLEDLQTQHAEKMAEIARARQEKKPDQQAIADLVSESKDLEKQITAEAAAVDQNGRALKRSREIRASLKGSMHDEKMELLGLKTQYEEITKQLEDAIDGPDGLKELIKSREDAQKRYIDAYSAKPDVDKLVADAMADADLTYAEREEKKRKEREEAEKRSRIDQVALYKQALQEQIIATTKYQATLQKLKELGLDDETYTKLLDKGLEGQEFAEQLLRSGKSGIDQINKLNAEMLTKSTDLAKQAADNLYNAGISAAQGLVDGLTTKKAELEAAMKSLADIMVNSIKSKLKIKSPSRIFEELGRFTTQGLAKGLEDTRGVEGAVSNLGRTMTDSLARLINTDIDASPVITPVLDIAQFRKDIATMPGLDNVVPITAATSYGMGAATSEEVSATQLAALEAAYAAQGPSISLEQNNYSPEALDVVEVYRNTRNQMGQLKSALGVPT